MKNAKFVIRLNKNSLDITVFIVHIGLRQLFQAIGYFTHTDRERIAC